MKPYCGSNPLHGVTMATLVAIVLFSATYVGSQPTSTPQILRYHFDDPHTRAGFEHFYNLEYDKAIKEFEQVQQAHPDDAFAVNHLLSAVMFKELYRIGALDSELYAKEGFLASKQYPVDPKVKERISGLIERSLELSETKLKANGDDVDALYTRGV